MDYVRGRQVGLEVNNLDNNGQTKGWRVRSTVLGTIVSSTPRHSKAPNFSYQVNPAAGGGASYAAYVANNANNRRAAVFVGANAGMFHAFDANPNVNQNGGRELFAYVPRSTYPYLSELTNPEYTHRYFVDGPVVEGDVYSERRVEDSRHGLERRGAGRPLCARRDRARGIRLDQSAVGHHAGRRARSRQSDGQRLHRQRQVGRERWQVGRAGA